MPLALVAALACLVFVGSLLLGARAIDRAERQREETQIGRDIDRRMSEIGGRTNAFALWDEALRNVDGRVNNAWAEENIRSLSKNRFHQKVLVLDHDDRPVYAAQTSGNIVPATVAALAAAAAPAVADIRRAEAARIPPRVNVPVRAWRIALVDGRPALIIASLIRSDTGKLRSLHARAPILVIQASVDVNLREVFAARFLLDDLRVAVVSAPAAEGQAEVHLADLRDGRRIVLRWTPAEPGVDMLTRSIPFLVLAALGVAVAGAAVARHAHVVTRKLLVSQAEARRLALRDPLTGLANRLMFSNRLQLAREQLTRGGHVVGLLCLDLDRFKHVNDAWGHSAGDELIREVALRLTTVCRAGDTIARLGGDEFALISRASDVNSVAALADRVIETLSGTVRLAAAEVELSCSVGVTVIVDSVLAPEEALRQADVALYRAKDLGRGRVCFFESEMDAVLNARKTLEGELRIAVESGAVIAAFQPLVGLDGTVVAVEALARWDHPVRCEVGPATFIPIAEASGLIDALTISVFRRACLAARAWGDLRVALNMSPGQLRRPGLIERLVAILDETGISATRLDLGLTESVLSHDDLMTQEVLVDLRGLGFRLVLDDFGTGTSSLSYLHRYPVQKIKLHRSFVKRLGVTAETRAIVKALLGLADALSLEVVAEGVDTRQQFELLRDMGCREFQGTLFAPPTTADAITDLVCGGVRLGPAGASGRAPPPWCPTSGGAVPITNTLHSLRTAPIAA